ncbi:GNAT family N-acetyltransferase [Kribbella solani]|uniref:GNAT family N-acetyltransferase n=1 Tax=Kribbella solani TaxID=236067 RepID=UPI0029A6EBDF|nr:GNAT family N-acetyltransferase [Kribbella solani]MDX2971864.1 GNAT family N-acetyltransferase [Kribbella solani]MDX3000392.1 GNAT family N-acetyltransferase [Kribbella solani]
MKLPDGYAARPMRLADAALIADRSAAYTTALLGFAMHSPEDVANYLRDPAINLATDGWVVLDPNGEFAGSATAVANSDGSRVNVDILSDTPLILNWLLDQAEQRAAGCAGGPAADRSGVGVRVGVVRQDVGLREVVAARGYAVDTTIHRMRIGFDGAAPAPAVPDGVVVRRGALDEPSRRAVHAVLMAAFAEQPSALPRPFEEWVASRESRSTFDWSQVTIVELAGRPVGVTECNDNFVSTDNCGYVGRLAVVPSARGLGLAKFLLRTAFATDAAAGRSGTILHVDTHNPTPAVALYTGLGMRPDLITDSWLRILNQVPGACRSEI